VGAVIRTKEFDERFYYNQNDLGAAFYSDHIMIKIWAPTASAVVLKLIHANSGKEELYVMARQRKGVWEKKLPLDKEGYYYRFLIDVNGGTNEAVDPYAVAATANSEYGVLIN
ncbi:type I pullulanase, partial [Priestia megaterium]